MEIYRGLHFPAGDIPPQARHLYKISTSGLAVFPLYNPWLTIPFMARRQSSLAVQS